MEHDAAPYDLIISMDVMQKLGIDIHNTSKKSFWTPNAIAKKLHSHWSRPERIRAVLNEKQSISHFLHSCCDNFTENEVEQEELNTSPTTPYQTFVFLHGGLNRKKLYSHWSRPEQESVI
jgi:hypothetical protein